MKIGYLLDTHGGPYNMPTPSGARVTAFIDYLWREAEAVEQAGFDSLIVPERHVRTEGLFPSPLLFALGQLTRVSRSSPSVAAGFPSR
jgi:alkanesulfonate monooxygenase SsuD/methylene tetrahydromethanopterin reductase-like flavin-dependent oxidoreductase (luciferase family)